MYGQVKHIIFIVKTVMARGECVGKVLWEIALFNQILIKAVMLHKLLVLGRSKTCTQIPTVF